MTWIRIQIRIKIKWILKPLISNSYLINDHTTIVLNRTFSFLPRGSLEITLTVPLKKLPDRQWKAR